MGRPDVLRDGPFVDYAERFFHQSAVSCGSKEIIPPLRFPGMVPAANLAGVEGDAGGSPQRGRDEDDVGC